MATQGTDNLVIVDNMPSVEKLWNGRYRLEFFCKIQNPNEGWYSDSIDKWLPSFGALQDADFAGEGWSTRDGEAYPDMRLVECEAKYIAPSETHLVTLTYETLTASWVAEKDEDIDYELNGLQRVSRTFVALPGTSYTKVVGTDTITVGGDTLTLGAFKIEETDATWSLTETWLESGILNVQRRSESEGVYRVTTTFLGEGAPVIGPIIAKVEDNYEGLKTTTVVSMQDAGGSSLVSGESQPVASHSNLSEFSYPGVVTISSETLTGLNGTYTFRAKDFSLKPPVVARVAATIKVSFKPTSAISYTATDGLWNPTTWAEGFSRGIGWNYSPFSISRGFRGYRIDHDATNGYSGYGIPGTLNIFDMISGKRIFGSTTYSIAVSGGPENPDGNQYTLDYSVSLAFEDVGGTPYYKHKEIVATIPTQ